MIQEIHENHLATLEARLQRINVEFGWTSQSRYRNVGTHAEGEFERQLFNDFDLHLFLAAPMAGFASDEEFSRFRLGMMEVVRSVRSLPRTRTVFYAGEDRENSSRFEDQAEALLFNLDMISRSQFFAVVLPGEIYSSTLVELGIAIQSGTPGVIFVRERGQLPFLLQEVDKAIPSIEVHSYRDFRDIIARLPELLPKLPPESEPPYDIAEHSGT